MAFAAMDDRRFEYHRVGCDHRPMVFRGDGTFAAGGAGCERYWTIREGRLLIAGDGGWVGRWVVHERMVIRLEPKA